MVTVVKMTKKKKILIILVITTVLIFAVFFLISYLNYLQYKAQETYLETHYIFDKNFRANKTNQESSGNKYLSHGLVTAEILKLFRFLQQKFEVKSITDFSDHYHEVRQYLHSRFKEEEAERLFEIYRKYLPCQIKLTNDSKYEVKSTDPKHLLTLLYTIQTFRRDQMGKENADALFGREVKDKEYFIRRGMIIVDNILYGKEKESRLRKLKNDMWNGEAILIGEESNPYNRYQLKLQLYQKDLSELVEAGRKLKIEEFRKEFFSKEQIKRLHDVDDQIAREKQNLERYRAAERKILDLKNVIQEEKDKRIKLLQDEFFGKEADAFRRREVMRKALEK
jgi:lipase chaperone LimK